MRTKSLLAAAFCAVAVGAVGAGSAFAGEITGNGTSLAIGTTPEGDTILHGKSECAFSGQNDGFHLDPKDPAYEAERVQSFGQVVKVAGPLGGVPGAACNPSGSRG